MLALDQRVELAGEFQVARVGLLGSANPSFEKVLVQNARGCKSASLKFLKTNLCFGLPCFDQQHKVLRFMQTRTLPLYSSNI